MSEHKLAPGDKAPDFTLPDADGKPVSLSSLRGQQVIVYFYPAAMTPGCTTEACDFRDNLSSLAAAGVTVLGISPDQPAKLGIARVGGAAIGIAVLDHDIAPAFCRPMGHPRQPLRSAPPCPRRRRPRPARDCPPAR